MTSLFEKDRRSKAETRSDWWLLLSVLPLGLNALAVIELVQQILAGVAAASTGALSPEAQEAVGMSELALVFTAPFVVLGVILSLITLICVRSHGARIIAGIVLLFAAAYPAELVLLTIQS